jgi:hypothetical protein
MERRMGVSVKAPIRKLPFSNAMQENQESTLERIFT